jgi:hypothetical protein
MKALPLTTIALSALLLLPACGGTSTQTVTGAFTLTSTSLSGGWTSCSGDGGYSDFGRGMNVTIRNGAGEIIGTATTRNLTRADLGDFDSTNTDDLDKYSTLELSAALAQLREGSRCTVWFETEAAKADFYSVAVGRRGELTYSAKELADKDWHVELTLGG